MSPPASPDRDATLAAFRSALDEGRFFEAREIPEAYWVADRSEDRDFYRGLIQAAVALHHASRGNLTGARSVAARARAHLVPHAPRHAGVEVQEVLERLDEAVR